MRWLFLTILFVGFRPSIAQENLAINGGFEQIPSCSFTSGFIDSMVGLSDLYNTEQSSCDAFNICSTYDWYSIPNNLYGFQEPIEGDGYAGFIPRGVNEALLGSLSYQLSKDTVYTVSFGLSLHDSSRIAASQLGFVFWDSAVSFPTSSQGLITADFEIPYPVTEKNSWDITTFLYVANGSENYYSIGLFGPIDSTTFQPGLEGNSNGTYYLLDNVIVRKATQNEINGLRYHTLEFGMYPNPATDQLRIESKRSIARVTVRDIHGRALLTQKVAYQKDPIIDVATLPPAVYLLEVYGEDGRRGTRRFVKVN